MLLEEMTYEEVKKYFEDGNDMVIIPCGSTEQHGCHMVLGTDFHIAKEFAKRINKSEDWQYSNEAGRSRYFFNDIIDIANKYNLEIIIRDKEKK